MNRDADIQLKVKDSGTRMGGISLLAQFPRMNEIPEASGKSQ